MAELLRVENLKVHYPIRSGFFNRVTDYVYAADGAARFELGYECAGAHAQTGCADGAWRGGVFLHAAALGRRV